MFTPQDQDNRRAGARGLTRNHGGLARSLRRAAAGAVCATVVALPLIGAADAQAAVSAPHALTSGWTSLALKNGWADYGFGTAAPAVTNISGIVHLIGAIMTEGSGVVPFTLPAGFRPAHTVYVPVDLCGSSNGRLDIYPSGVVDVEAENGPQWIPQCPVSLDGAWFAKSASRYTPLTLQNGWISYGSGTTRPAVRKINGIAHFEGAMYNGANSMPFTLPVGFRPSHYVYASVDTNVGTGAHIVIAPDGQVNVIGEGTQSDATLFTSLDGVSFAP